MVNRALVEGISGNPLEGADCSWNQNVVRDKKVLRLGLTVRSKIVGASIETGVSVKHTDNSRQEYVNLK